MAGSLDHVLHGWDMIENMGDAYEAIEEMLWLILRSMDVNEALALIHNEYHPMCCGELEPGIAFLEMKRLMRGDE